MVVLAPSDGSDQRHEVEEARRYADRTLRCGARLMCFTVDRDQDPEAAASSLYHRGWARPRMWSQYAENHCGACLVFAADSIRAQVDRYRPLSDGDLFSYGAVHYVDKAPYITIWLSEVRSMGILEALNDFQVVRGVANQLYFTKSTDWASENESRIIVVRWNPPEDELDSPLDIPFGRSLRAIVVGELFDDGELEALRVIHARYPNVELVRCVWTGGRPALKPIE